MTAPILGDLFPETHRKEMTFAFSRDGELVDVTDVPNGLSCKCTCPQCGALLVAKNHSTEFVMAHFAHHHSNSRDGCKSAGETALHKAAKDMLASALKLSHPEHRLTDESETARFPAGTWRFDSATLEKANGRIVPDVVLSCGDRKLVLYRVVLKFAVAMSPMG